MSMNFNKWSTRHILAKAQESNSFTPPAELSMFMQKIRENYRGVQFAPVSKGQVWVYYPDEPFPLGFIGYGDFMTQEVGDDKYAVASRHITNDKYATYQDQHHMKTTVNLNTAVRNAKRFLRSWSPIELLRANLRDACNESQQSLSDTSSKVRNQMRDLFDQDRPAGGKMLAELRNLVTSGHVFLDAKFAEDLTLMFITLDEARALRDKPVHMYFVSVTNVRGQQTFTVGAVDNVNKGHFSADVDNNFERYTVDTIPEDIMGKLSVLSMVDAETYVDDVGYRADEGLFYVVRS